jgi:hypothetical protein
VTPEARPVTQALPDWQVLGFRVVGQSEPFHSPLALVHRDGLKVGTAWWSDMASDVREEARRGLAGTLRFDSEPPVHAALLLHHVVLDQQMVQPGQQDVRFVLDPDTLRRHHASVALRVAAAESGEPLTDANVLVNLSSESMVSDPVDAGGRAVVRVAPGVRFLLIRAPGRESLRRGVVADVGQHIDLGEIRLGPALAFEGRVVGTVPGTIVHVHCRALKWHHVAWPGYGGESTQCEPDGSFSFQDFGRGRVAVTATSIGRVPGQGSAPCRQARGVFDNPPTGPVELHLAPAALLSVVRPRDPSRSFVLTVFGSARDVIAAGPVAEGQVAWPLPQGKHAFEVHDLYGRLLRTGTVQLGDTPSTLELR